MSLQFLRTSLLTFKLCQNILSFGTIKLNCGPACTDRTQSTLLVHKTSATHLPACISDQAQWQDSHEQADAHLSNVSVLNAEAMLCPSWSICQRRLPLGARCCERQDSSIPHTPAKNSCAPSRCLTFRRMWCPSLKTCPPFSGTIVGDWLNPWLASSELSQRFP